jgi:hypothetical protein
VAVGVGEAQLGAGVRTLLADDHPHSCWPGHQVLTITNSLPECLLRSGNSLAARSAFLATGGTAVVPHLGPSSWGCFLSELDGGREMARRMFTVIDVAKILEHWYAGRAKMAMAPLAGMYR